MNRFIKLAALSTTLISGAAFADTISISNIDIHDLKSRHFQLAKDQKVEINYIAPKFYHQSEDDQRHDFVWIIDLDSREMVWRSRNSDLIDDSNNDKLALFGDNVSLQQGRYALYYSTHNFRTHHASGTDLFLYGLSSLLRDKNHISHEDIDDFYLDLRASDVEEISKGKTFAPFGERKELVSMRKVRKNRFKQFGLDVSADTELSIYAVGEIVKKDLADVAWLKDANSGEMVWQMDKSSTVHAGGSSKNRQFKDSIELSKGSYILAYSTDGSHHYNDWNSQPPYDPSAWGVSVYGDNNKISVYDPKQRQQAQKIVAITKVGDDASISKHFSLSQSTKVRVIALGERANRTKMADHGWITNSETGKTVWKMKARKTKHAGGSSKNRISDQVIELPAGNYTIQYVSDGSHSYDDGWNASRPHDEKNWGIRLYGVGKNFDQDLVTQHSQPQNGALAQIVAVGNNKKLTATFELSQDQDVRVYAIGEGDRDDMADYGYIKSAKTGKRVWYMFADETEHAGGARKNRQIDEVVRLKKGKYTVHYRTDSSHSFDDWNARPPTDELNYGITVYNVE